MTDPVDMVAEVKRYLDKLGTTTDEIHTSLADLKVTGRPRSSGSCPLARYLNDALPGSDLRVTTKFVRAPAMSLIMLELSPAQTDFVLWFDRGWWPEMIDHSL